METLGSQFKQYPYKLSLKNVGLHYEDLVDTLNLNAEPDPSTDTYGKGYYSEKMFVSSDKSTAIYIYREGSYKQESIGFKNRRDLVSFKTEYLQENLKMKTLKENKMNKESLREIVKLVDATISKKLNEGDYTGYLAGNNLRDRFNKKLNERIVHGEEEIWELNEPIKLFVEKYKGKPVDIFFTNDGKASVTKRTQNLVMHGKDSGRSLNLNNVKHVYSGLDNKFYRPEDIGKIFKSAYLGSNSRVRAINPNESTKITESAVPPFKSKREAIFAI